ncbi:MAG: hypothetical protein O7D29_00565 [Gemmatimonadetes bacterium]|nr:hypothetical protein [Gemmatimonadota bacterium]
MPTGWVQVLEQVFRVIDSPGVEGIPRLREGNRECGIVQNRHRIYALRADEQDVGVGEQLQAELDVVGGDRHPVVPSDVRAKVEGPPAVIGRMFPGGRQLTYSLTVLVEGHQRQENQELRGHFPVRAEDPLVAGVKDSDGGTAIIGAIFTFSTVDARKGNEANTRENERMAFAANGPGLIYPHFSCL